MKQLIDRIAYSFIGIIILVFIEGMSTFGFAFQFEHYTWIGYTVQVILIFLTVWMANKIYENDKSKAKTSS
jgi:uncharacterized membrane protein